MAAHDEARLVALTGGPGSGKTTLIDALVKAGHRVRPETGRAVIREEIAGGGTALPWSDREAFALRMLEADIASFEAAVATGGTIFFDRGIPDVVGYLRLCGLPVPEAASRAAIAMRYHAEVLVAPPWPEIFHADEERRQDFDEAVRTHAEMVRVYAELGYRLVPLPLDTPARRVRFVLDRLGLN